MGCRCVQKGYNSKTCLRLRNGTKKVHDIKRLRMNLYKQEKHGI
jgi:hypothetical protein